MSKKTEKQPQQNSWYDIKAAAKSKHADVYVYAEIGYWGITAKQFAKDLKDIAGDTKTIALHVNCIGGAIGDGVAIYNTLKNHPATITSYIDGYALSMGSIIALAGEQVLMAENALYMIHNPWGGAWGDAGHMRKQADVLDKHKAALLNTYESRTSLDRDELVSMMDEETWMTADEAVGFGFVDSTFEGVDAAASAVQLPSDMKQPEFRNAPDEFLKIFNCTKSAPVAAGVPSKPKQGKTMSDKNKPAADNSAEGQLTESEIRAKALEDERGRRKDIRAVFAPFGGQHQAVLDGCLDDTACTLETARAQLLTAIGQNSPGPVAGDPDTEVLETSKEKFAKGARLALAIRSGVAENDEKNEFRGHSLLELARNSLEMNGVSTGRLGRMEIVGAAFTHSSSDFTHILMDTAEKSMLKGWDEAEETFQSWTTKGTLTDFKPTNRVDLNSFPNLDKVAEGAEYKYGTVGDRGEQIMLATYGKMFSMTRQAIINDDVGSFTRIPARMGRAAIRTVGDLVYAILTSNPVMSDGKTLFHAGHKNIHAASSIATAAIDAMRVKMGTQKEGNANLNIRLATLLVPLALEGLSKTVRDAEFEVDPEAKDSRVPNSVRGTFNVISDARLDASSSTKWYGLANSAMHDTIEVAYLDGNDTPFLDQQQGWSVDGTEFKVRIDATAKALDYRTLVQNG